MDERVKWERSSPEEETLVDAIVQCAQNLVVCATMKHGKVTTLTSDAYAGSKIIELLQLGSRWRPCVELSDEGSRVPFHRQQKRMTELVADFGKFRLHRNEVMGEADVRVVMTFEVEGNSAPQMFFGNVELAG